MKKQFISLFLFLFAVALNAQNFQKTDNGIKYNTQGINVDISLLSPDIVRVVKSPEGTDRKGPDLVILKVIGKTDFRVDQHKNEVTISTEKVEVKTDLETGEILFNTANGKSLLREKPYGTQFSAIKDGPNDSYNIRQGFLLDKDEAIYGLGQQQTGKMNQRNQILPLQNWNMKVCIPFVQSVKGYGIYWDQYSISEFVDNPQEMSMQSVGIKADYYFMYGGNADGVIAQMRKLTGQSPMLPLWAYGFFQSRERYQNQFETLDVVKQYRKLGVPLDCIIQDWQYWGRDSLWNLMDFNPETFPRPQEMVDSVHQMNAKFMIVTWPGFGPLTPQYKELKDKNLLINFDTWPPKSGTKPYDVYSAEARDIYWRYLNNGIFSKNVDGFWLDSTEPDHINVKESDYDLPTSLGTFRSVHNAFPLMTVGGVYNHWRGETSDKRVVILTRSAFAGQQRYGANTWSGDVSSDWGTLRRQIPGALNFSLSGNPYWNSDIGGFFAGRYNAGGGAKNPDFQELYVRWMQFAAFTPMMRSHGTDIRREIYQFGKRGEWAFDVQEKYINLRYSLLPYIYSTSWDVSKNNGTFMRALVMDFSQDKNVWNIDNEYMFGQSFLVNPVTEKGKEEQDVYLPGGSDWFDFWTNEKTTGGITVTKKTMIDIIPLYVKAGSIIPFGPKVQFATEKKWDNLELRIYPGADGTFTLYEDENDNYNYEKGAYTEILLTWNNDTKTLTIGNRKGNFKGMLKNRKFTIKRIDGDTKTITYKGKEIKLKIG